MFQTYRQNREQNSKHPCTNYSDLTNVKIFVTFISDFQDINKDAVETCHSHFIPPLPHHEADKHAFPYVLRVLACFRLFRNNTIFYISFCNLFLSQYYVIEINLYLEMYL